MSAPVSLHEKWNPKSQPSYEDYFNGYLFALVGSDHNVNLSRVCVDQKPYAFERQFNSGDIAFAFFSFGIYTPMTLRVWCGD